jgi:ELWxxDGT repeat protein
MLNNELYLAAQDGTSGSNQEIWKTDGTENGTIKVIDATALNNVSPNFSLQDKKFTVFNNKLIFEHNTQQIWVTDGTNSGTQQLTNTGTPNVPTGVAAFQPIIYNSEIYFGGNYPTQGVELWKITDTSLSTQEIASAQQLSLYPNPANDSIYIKTIDNGSNLSIKIFNSLGALVKETHNTYEVKINDLQPGLYLMNITQNNKQVVKKFIKQ